MFLRNVLATLVGLFLFFFLLIVIAMGIAAVASGDKKVVIEENSVLRLRLDQPIVEQAMEDPFAELAMALSDESAPLSLMDLKMVIKDAAENENITGIYLEPRMIQAGYAKLKEIHDDLVAFKESGKFVLAYGEYLTEKDFYIASTADEMYMTPEGMVEFNGLSAQSIFFRGTLDKLEIEPQIFKVGEYKSAAEPFTNKKLSEANREQIRSFVNSMYDSFIGDISRNLEIDQQRLRQISDSMLVRTPKQAEEYGFITGQAYYDDVMGNLRDKVGLEEDDKITFVSPRKYRSYMKGLDPKISKNRVAVIVGDGEIVWGKGEDNIISSEKYAAEIRKARNNDRVKAIVLRINSPGGSALASDIIWKEIIEARKQKPVIASMSDLAASGGYYIAMGCDTIVAQPTTLTGSIGVIGVILNMQDFFDNKLGMTSDKEGTGVYSDFPTGLRPLTESEKEIFQEFVNDIYESFTAKAAEGRDMDLVELKQIAQGRVWTGSQAVENGLIDVLGGYDDAIRIAADAAGLGDDYRVNMYPKPKNVFEQVMSELSGDFENTYMEAKFGELYPYLTRVKQLRNYRGIQARLPYDLVIQ